MSIGSEITHPELSGNVFSCASNDASQRAFFERWADLVGAGSWAEVPAR